MIKEAYVSFEIAKLLKEKGFDECTFEFYEGNRIVHAYGGFRLSEIPDIYYPHIIHQMVCAWLREVHNKHMQIAYGTYGWYYDIIDLKEVSVYDSFTDVKSWYNAGGFDTYEEAIESALKYTLENLI